MNINVEVFLKHDVYGNKRPMFIRWNNGTLYVIDTVKKVSSAVCDNGLKVIKYEIVVGNKNTCLYEDLYHNNWYVLEK